MSPKFSRDFCCTKHGGNIGEVVDQVEELCDGVETVREFTFLGGMVSASGGCEAIVTVMTRCWWYNSWECGKLLYRNMFRMKPKWTVYANYMRPSILFGSEVWYLKVRRMKILQRSERSMVKVMCGILLKDRKRA